MMKKRVLAGTLVTVLALSAGLSFADDTRAVEKKDRMVREMQERREENGLTAEELQEIIDTHYPEVSDTWNELKTELKAVHDKIRELRGPAERPEMPDFDSMTDEEIEALKTELFERMKQAAENREETGERGGPDHGGFPDGESRENLSDLTDEEREALKEERQAEREARQAEREAFKQAVEEGDTDAIVAHIDTLIDALEERLESAQERLSTLESEE